MKDSRQIDNAVHIGCLPSSREPAFSSHRITATCFYPYAFRRLAPAITPCGRPHHVKIARSAEPASIVAKRYGISDETVRTWRKRGEHANQDGLITKVGHILYYANEVSQPDS